MWMIVLLAIAVNFEPTRIGLVSLLLAREKPLLQLLAFLVANLTTSLSFGILVLFVFQNNPFGTSSSNGGRIEVAIGAIALVVSAIMALRWMSTRCNDQALSDSEGSRQSVQPRRIDKFTDSIRRILRKGSSPWVAGLVGVCVGLPSVDYLAVLAIISTSLTPPSQKVAALVMFVLTGSLVVLAPFVGFVIAPAKTLDLLHRIGAWIRSRRQIEYAGLLAALGCLLIGIGYG